MSDANREMIRRFVERREADRRAALGRLLAEAQSDFERIVEYLIREHRPLRIYQWGSLLHPERFSEISDIDIAVEGFSDPLEGIDAAAEAQRLTDFDVDLVELERIDPLHADSIREDGTLTYERP